MKDEGRVVAVKLQRKSGYVSCNNIVKSYWGCGPGTNIYVYVTDDLNRILLPKTLIASFGSQQKVWYTLLGYNSNSKELVLTDYATAIYGNVGMEFRIWYSEDLLPDCRSDDNSGHTCADVYAMFD